MRLDPASPFSVVIPLHQGERHIRRALTCIAAQSRPPREIIVVDDGSTDDGARIAAEHIGVLVIRQENRGIGPAKNRGIAEATGPWVALMDQDDHWFPDHLEELGMLVREHPEAGLVATASREVALAELPRATASARRRGRRRRIDYLRRAGRRIGIIHTSAAAVRCEAHAAVGGFADRSGPDDIDLWARLALAHPVAHSTRCTSLWVRGTGGMMERTRRAEHERAEPTGWTPLLELSLSVRSVAAALQHGQHTVPRRSRELYIDGRATAGWRGVLTSASQAPARRRWRELHHPFHWSAWPFLLAAWLPIPVGRLLAGVRASLITRLRARPR